MPRTAEVIVVSVALVALAPLLLLLAVVVAVSSRGPVLYRQRRVGRDGRHFTLLKFRTMRVGADVDGRLTVGDRDPRITAVGRVLRRRKLDELPQLVNVLRGEMALVGPRPEVPEYAVAAIGGHRCPGGDDLDADRQVVRSARPGLTDPTSLRLRSESELLAAHDDPDTYYREVLAPAKIALSAAYLRRRSARSDLGVLWATMLALISRRPSTSPWPLAPHDVSPGTPPTAADPRTGGALR